MLLKAHLVSALLLVFAATLHGETVQDLIALSRKLTVAHEPIFCSEAKQQMLRLNSLAIEHTRLCGALSEKCMQYNTTKSNMASCYKCPEDKTAEYQAQIAESAAACEKLGVQPGAKTPSCPDTTTFEADLAAANNKTCPPLNNETQALAHEFHNMERELIIEAGMEQSAYPVLQIEPTVNATNALVLLHGVGQSVYQLIPYVRQMQLYLPSTRFVLPQAPVQNVTFFNASMHSWFNILGNTADAPQAETEILAASDAVAHIGDIQRNVYGIEKVGIAGLSQGGAVALTTYMTARWESAVSVASFLPLLDKYPGLMTNDSANIELLMMHGTADEVIPFKYAIASEMAIKLFGRNATLVPFPGETHRLYGKWKESAELGATKVAADFSA